MPEALQRVDSDGSAENERLKDFQSRLAMQLRMCRKIIEEDTFMGSLESIQSLDQFIEASQTLRSTIAFAELCNSEIQTVKYDRSTSLQILKTRREINDQLDQLIHLVNDLIEHLGKKKKQLFGYKGSHLAAKFSRRRCGSKSNFQYPSHDCKRSLAKNQYPACISGPISRFLVPICHKYLIAGASLDFGRIIVCSKFGKNGIRGG
ncbi:hypothetical protein GCK32_008386 [Trichostrongylus colubriformis]|uniref:Uncharacterized protein n=1 Tax=Trichostrongylus colubriformis TaxID=6319 RepID=A0AAN8F876_TRICO